MCGASPSALVGRVCVIKVKCSPSLYNLPTDDLTSLVHQHNAYINESRHHIIVKPAIGLCLP